MSRLISWFVIFGTIWFFIFVVPAWVEGGKARVEREIAAAPANGPKPKAVKTKYGEIKRARLEGSDKRNVELVEYPNGLTCVKFRIHTAHGKGAGIDCDWSKYSEKGKKL